MEYGKDSEKDDGEGSDNDREETKLSAKKVILWVLIILFTVSSLWYLLLFSKNFFQKGSGGGFETPQVPLD